MANDRFVVTETPAGTGQERSFHASLQSGHSMTLSKSTGR